MNKVWLVPHPTDQFEEDVKRLARMNELTIIDAKFEKQVDPKMVESKPPKLTKVKKQKAEKPTAE